MAPQFVPQGQFPFFDLPPELRREILEYTDLNPEHAMRRASKGPNENQEVWYPNAPPNPDELVISIDAGEHDMPVCMYKVCCEATGWTKRRHRALWCTCRRKRQRRAQVRREERAERKRRMIQATEGMVDDAEDETEDGVEEKTEENTNDHSPPDCPCDRLPTALFQVSKMMKHEAERVLYSRYRIHLFCHIPSSALVYLERYLQSHLLTIRRIKISISLEARHDLGDNERRQQWISLLKFLRNNLKIAGLELIVNILFDGRSLNNFECERHYYKLHCELGIELLILHGLKDLQFRHLKCGFWMLLGWFLEQMVKSNDCDFDKGLIDLSTVPFYPACLLDPATVLVQRPTIAYLVFHDEVWQSVIDEYKEKSQKLLRADAADRPGGSALQNTEHRIEAGPGE